MIHKNTLVDYKLNKSETISPIETVCFTNIFEKQIKSLSPLKHSRLLGLIAAINKLNCDFTPIGFVGEYSAILKAQSILIESIKYN